MKGNVDAIIQEAKKLEQTDEKFKVFVTKLQLNGRLNPDDFIPAASELKL